MKMNRGELIGFNRCYGYRNENDKLEIIDEEAEVVKFIFDKYCIVMDMVQMELQRC